ncbi:hypothetical protein [Sphingobium yanoikuyae]|uniref:hypothetical protein n=1 Tax=Sphingobium yanoikuyae TaxID=13690 RepID=UPI00345E7EF5
MMNNDTRQAWVTFLGQRAFSHAVTLKPNHRTERSSPQFLRSAFTRFHRDVDQFLIGPRYHKPSKRHLRTEAIGIMEGLPLTGHIHAAFRLPADRWNDFEGLFRPLNGDVTVNPKWVNPWAWRIAGGTSHVERITDSDGWMSYSTKYFNEDDVTDRIIFLPFDA